MVISRVLKEVRAALEAQHEGVPPGTTSYHGRSIWKGNTAKARACQGVRGQALPELSAWRPRDSQRI